MTDKEILLGQIEKNGNIYSCFIAADGAEESSNNYQVKLIDCIQCYLWYHASRF